MKLLRTVLAVFVAVFVATVSIPQVGSAANGQIVDENWAPEWPTGLGYQGVRFRDTAEWNESVSTLRARYKGTAGWWKGCSSISTEPCASADEVAFSATLQPCALKSDIDCILEFGVIDDAGSKNPASYTNRFPQTGLNDFPANQSIGLPEGGPAGIWTVPGPGLPISQKHMVRAVVSGTAVPGKKVSFDNFFASISPVEVVSMPCGEDDWSRGTGCRVGDYEDVPANHGGEEGWWGYSDDYGSRHGFDCVLSGNFDASSLRAECAQRKALSKDVKYFLSVRLSQVVPGWMHGRMSDPTVSIAKISGVSEGAVVSISGNPVSVPSIVVDKQFSELPTHLQDSYRSNGGWPRTGGGYWDPAGGGTNEDPSDPYARNRRSLPSPYGLDSLSELDAWLPVVNDTAIADPSTWTLRSLESSFGQQFGCPTEKNTVSGIVTTNATVYKAETPDFDANTQSLQYTVSAPHYMSSGEVFRGAYSLIIRSDLARCIYRFSSAPLKATIEVFDSGSEKISAVTNVSEKNGWIKLSATGFTHSTPTIRAKFKQGSSKGIFIIGQSIEKISIANQTKIKVDKNSKISLVIIGNSSRVCRIIGSSVKTTARGTCSVRVTIMNGTKKTSSVVNLTIS